MSNEFAARRIRNRNRRQREQGYLGSRPTVKLARNPLTDPTLAQDLQLEYAVTPQAEPRTIPWLLLSVGLSLFALAVAGASNWGAPLQLRLVIVLGVLLIALLLMLLLRRYPQRFDSLIPVVLIAFCLLSGPYAPFVLLAYALLRIANAADAYAFHYGRWLGAYMYLPVQIRRTWMALWQTRSIWDEWRDAELRTHEDDDEFVLDRELPERLHARRRWPVLVATLLSGYVTLMASPSPVIGGLLAVLVVTALLALYGYFDIEAYRRSQGLSRRQVSHALADADASWRGYQSLPAPGVFVSPAGDLELRMFRLRGPYLLLILGTVWLAAFFPVVLLAWGPGPWAEANAALADKALGSELPTMRQSRRAVESELGSVATLLEANERERLLEIEAAQRYAGQLAAARSAELLPLETSPVAWIRVSVLGFTAHPVLFASALLASAISCVLFPRLLFAVAFRALSGRLVLHHFAAYADERAAYIVPRTEWDAIVEQIQTSPDPIERRHLFLGFCAEAEFPILLDRDILRQHGHLMGGTGSGKTSRGLAPLITQLANPDESIVVLDLKGDMSLFEAARVTAERTGLPFKWFTSHAGHSTYAFNPFTQRHMRAIPPLERTEIFTKALGLEYGEGYGKSHFSRTHRGVLLRLFRIAPHVDSFRQLAFEFNRHRAEIYEGDRKLQEHSSDLQMVIEALAEIEPINVTANRDPNGTLDDVRHGRVCADAIDVGDFIRSPSVAYFHLPAAIHSAAHREVGKFALHAILTAAFVTPAHKRRQVWVVIDEFQEVVADDLGVFFEQARAMQIAIVLSNQTYSQLQKTSPTLVNDINANTSFQMVFNADDVEHRRLIQELSGEEVYEFRSMGQADNFASGARFGYTEQLGPRFRPNDLIEMGAEDDECWIHIKRNRGFSQFDGYPFRAVSEFHIPKDAYEIRSKAPWPSAAAHPGTMAPSAGDATSEPDTGPSKPDGHAPTKPPSNSGNVTTSTLDSLKLGDKPQ